MQTGQLKDGGRGGDGGGGDGGGGGGATGSFCSNYRKKSVFLFNIFIACPRKNKNNLNS